MIYVAKFWRSNPQHKDGGYETKREIEAANIRLARKKATVIENKTVYGSMRLLSLKREVSK